MRALWELEGIGHVERRVVGDSAAIRHSAGMTSVIGAWDQYGLIDTIDGLTKSGFVLYSVRRLDTADCLSRAIEKGSPLGKLLCRSDRQNSEVWRWIWRAGGVATQSRRRPGDPAYAGRGTPTDGDTEAIRPYR